MLNINMHMHHLKIEYLPDGKLRLIRLENDPLTTELRDKLRLTSEKYGWGIEDWDLEIDLTLKIKPLKFDLFDIYKKNHVLH